MSAATTTTTASTTSQSQAPATTGTSAPGDNKELHALVLQLTNSEQRETALLELSKKRESFAELAPVLWHSFGTIAALLQVKIPCIFLL